MAFIMQMTSWGVLQSFWIPALFSSGECFQGIKTTPPPLVNQTNDLLLLTVSNRPAAFLLLCKLVSWALIFGRIRFQQRYRETQRSSLCTVCKHWVCQCFRTPQSTAVYLFCGDLVTKQPLLGDFFSGSISTPYFSRLLARYQAYINKW